MSNQNILKPLHQRPDFILSIAIPLIASTLIGITIIVTDKPGQFCFSAECYGNFVELFKLPIALLALAFPLAGMVAAYHRSIETNEQIKIALANNTFSNFIKHRQDFIEYIDEYFKNEHCGGQLVDSRKLYRLVFPKNTYTVLKTYITDPTSIEILADIEEIYKKLAAISSAKEYSDDEYNFLFSEIIKINRKMQLAPKKDHDISISYKGNIIYNIIFTKDNPMENIHELAAIANRIRSFNHLSIPRRPEWTTDSRLSESIGLFIHLHDLKVLRL